MTDKTDCIACGEKWIEIHLVDELNNPILNIEYELYQAFGPMKKPRKGIVKANGIIREEGLAGFPIILKLDTQALIKEMSTRKLRLLRGENNSIIKAEAEAKKYTYRYTTIGALCRDQIDIDNKGYQDEYPFYHFPKDEAFKGIPISKFNTTTVIEICPFRAWSLILHHTEQYSMINAYNLGILSQLSYKDNNIGNANSISCFFERQCLDLSRYPVVREKEINAQYPAIVIDVPFEERYDKVVFLDTEDKIKHDSKAEGSTQLFYVQNKEQFIVSWRGSQEGTDWVDDFSYRAKDIKTHAPEFNLDGKMHKGFLGAYQLGKNFFPREFGEINKLSADINKKLFICGHSLGGALALAHATELHKNIPLLYTYGAPRLFTISALEQLPKFTHYRHINNNDIVPRVPPEASLDNWLFNIYGYLGNIIGGITSIIDLLGQKAITQYGEYYLHHGNPILFYEAYNLIENYEEKVPTATNTWRFSYSKNNSTKLYIVPEIDKLALNDSMNLQQEFMSNLNENDKNNLFPEQKNPESNGGTSVTDHYMGRGYLPFLHDQLLELVDSAKTPQRLQSRELFKIALDKKVDIINPNPYKKRALEIDRQRNLYFLDLQQSMNNSLIPMQSNPKEMDMLMQFKEQTHEIFNQ